MQSMMKMARRIARGWHGRRLATGFALLLGSTGVHAAVELTLTFAGPPTHTPGTSATYTMVVGNTGTTTDSPALATDFPVGTGSNQVAVAWSCSPAGGASCGAGLTGTDNLAHSTDVIPQNGTVTYSFTVTFPSAFSTSPLTVVASANPTPVGLLTLTESETSTRSRISDASISKTSSASTYAPGGTGRYTLTVRNSSGPSDAFGVGVVDNAPTGVTITSWVCSRAPSGACPAVSGSGNLSETVNIPVGVVYTYILNVEFASNASAASIVNSATLSPAATGDPDSANNSDSATVTRDPKADFALAFTPSSSLSYIPGSTGNALTLRVTNGSGSNAVSAPVALDFPLASVATVRWDCDDPAECSIDGGNGDLSTIVTLDAGAFVNIVMSLGYDSGSLANPMNLVAVLDVDGAPGTDPPNDPADLRLTNAYAIVRRADVGVVKTGPVVASPGAGYTYELLVSNAGPSDVGNGPSETGIQIDDDFVATLRGDTQACTADPTQPCWTYCPSDGGTVGAYTPANCPVAVITGSGDLVDRPMRLRNGSSSIIRAFVSTALSTRGQIDNTASVAIATSTPAITELGAGNNSDAASVTIEPTTDIVVSKTSNVSAVSAGTVVTYEIDVSNQGFESASNVAVQDILPLFAGAQTAGFLPGSISWQCRASGDACCTHNGAANACGTTANTPPVTSDTLTTAVDLPNRLSSVRFFVTGTVHPSASGTLVNSATATLPAGLSDSNLANNTESDSVPIGSEAQLSIQKTLLTLAPDSGPPFVLTYQIVVANAGPSRVENASVRDPLSDTQLVASGATWTCAVLDNPGATQCDAANGSGALATTVDLDAGGRIALQVAVPTVAAANGQITNTATIAAGTLSASSTVITNLAGAGDLSVIKRESSNQSSAVPGTEIEYTITVRNSGPDAAFGARITDALPPGLENASWTCAATTPVPGDLAPFARAGGTTGGQALATSADGRHVYIASQGGAAVSAYDRVNVPGQGFGNIALLETEIEAINDSQDVGSAVSGLQKPIDLALSTDGTMLYVLSLLDAAKPASIAAFNRVTNPLDPAFGKLSFAGSISVGGTGFVPARIVASPTNLYVSGSGGGTATVAIFRRSAATGLPLRDIDFIADVPQQPGAMAISVGDAALFVASSGSGGSARIARFRIEPAIGPNPPGRLTHQVSVNDATLSSITDLAIAPAQHDLYALAAGSERLARLDFQSTLVTSSTSSAAALGVPGARPFFGNVRIALAADGEHLLLTNAGSVDSTIALVQLRRDTLSGGLNYEASFTGANALDVSGASDIAVTPDGRHVLISSALTGSGRPQLTVYTRRAPDPLFGFLEVDRDGDNGGTVTGLQSPADIAVSGDGNHVYAVSLAEGALTVFRRDARSGGESDGTHLTHVRTYVDGQNSITGLARASRVLVSPDRLSVFVSSEDNNTVAAFRRNDNSSSPQFGQLTFVATVRDGVGGVDGLLGAQGMAMDESSSNLYVAGSFESAVATFARDGNGALIFRAALKAGSGGAVGMNGLRDLVVSGDGRNVMGVSSLSNAVVVFTRDLQALDTGFGRLQFLQARTLSGVRLMSLAIPSTVNSATDNEHIYVVGQDDSSLFVLRRVVDPASSAFGTVSTLFEYRDLPGLNGPRDVAVSADGRRVYVGSQFGSSVLILDRDLNRSSQNYGALSPVEVRTDGADGVEGLSNLYALAASHDSRHVYVAGFGDRAIASFAVGTGSYCSAAGSGDIDDRVNIGSGGTLVYRVRAFIRADATGALGNTACAVTPERFVDPNPGNNCSTHSATLTPQGDVAIFKSNDRVSATAGEMLRYEVRVTNSGPSNLVHGGGNTLTVTDLLDSNPGFVPGTATWTCQASGSGALDFVAATFDGDIGTDRLAGVTDLVVLADSDRIGAVDGPLPGLLASASVLDDAVTLFERDPGDGRLRVRDTATHGGTVQGTPINSLAGARALWASPDGRFLYVASRVSDAVTVFAIEDAGVGVARLRVIEVQRSRVGLDQAAHLAATSDGRFLYVAGSNDDGIAAFRRDPANGTLTWVDSEQNGVDDVTDGGAAVVGLDGVEYLVVSPDDQHLYAISSSGASIARFDIDGIDGRLSWREVRDADDFGISINGAAAAVFAADGKHLYLAAADANRVVVLARRTQASAGDFGELHLDSSVTQDINGSLGLVSPRRVALSGDGAHLYVTAQSGSSIAWYGRDPTTGDLQYLGQRSSESADVQGLLGATGIAIDAELDQVYVAGTLDASVVQFARQADSSCPPSGSGDLNAIEVSIAAGGSVTFIINVQVSSTLSGALTNVASVNSSADTDPANNSSTDVDEPSLLADLRISKDDGLAAYDGLAGARAVVGTADHVYVAGAGDSAIGQFARESDVLDPDFGTLEFLRATRSGVGGVLGLNAVADLALSADGAHLYAVSPIDSSVAAFTRDPASGDLVLIELERNGVLGVTGLSGARAVALSPDGHHVYVASEFANAIAAFSRQTDPGVAGFGSLSFLGIVQQGIGGADGLQQPIALAVAPGGQHVYALSGSGNAIAVLRRNPNPGSGGFGTLSFLRRYQGNVGAGSGLEAGRSLAFDATGAHLYVLGAAPGTLAHFLRTAVDGSLALDQVVDADDAGGAALVGASRVRIAPDGQQAYVAGGDDALSFFRIDSAGRLAFGARIADGDDAGGGAVVLGLDDVRDVLVTADGAHAYSVAAGDDALSGFERDPAPTAGGLTYIETFFDGLGGVAPGAAVRYRIEVANAGPAAVTQARVTDIFPPQFVSASWTCVAQVGNGQCVASGQGNLDTIVSLPANASVTFEAIGVLGDSVSGTLVNTATVSAEGSSDPDATNNQATDGNTVLSPALDLRTRFTGVVSSNVPGSRIDYAFEIANLGPTYANGATIRDRLPAALLDVEWSCNAFPVAGVLTTAQALPSADGSVLASFTALAPSALGTHLYATAELDGTSALLAYARDPLDGTLRLIEAHRNGIAGVGGIDGASDVLLSADERFVYVAGSQGDAIALFSRDTQSGKLTYVTRYQDGVLGIDGLGGVRKLLLAPGGARLYAAGEVDDAIAVFAVAPDSGLLTPSSVVRQSPLDGLNGVRDIAWSADAAHLLVIARANQSLAAFARNPATGALTQSALLQEFESNQGALVDPVALEVRGGRVLLASAANGRVTEFEFDPAAAQPFTTVGIPISNLADPADLLFDPDQARLYIATRGSDLLQLFSLIGETPVALAQYSASGVQALASSPNARQLYSAGDSLVTWARERGSRCALAGDGELGEQIVDIAPGGRLEYALGGDIFPNATGALVYEVSADPRELGAELDPSDNVASDTRSLRPAPMLSATKTDSRTQVVAGETVSYQIGLDNTGVSAAVAAHVIDQAPLYPTTNAGLLAGAGSWTCAVAPALLSEQIHAAATHPALQGIGRIALSPDGARLYAVNSTRDSLLVIARLPDGSLGAVQEIVDGSVLGAATVAGLNGASAVALSADGRAVLVTGAEANSLVVFGFDPVSGAHSFVQRVVSGSNGVSGLLGPSDVVLGDADTQVFVASPGADSIAVFRRDPATGLLSFVERVRDGFGTIVPDSNVIVGVRRLHVSADGRNLYAVAATSHAVSSFAIDANSGVLDYLGVIRRANVAGLEGARELLAAPGDAQLYVLGGSAIVRFTRRPDGLLLALDTTSAAPGLVQPRALVADRIGARVYVIDAAGAVSVFARDWSSGVLAYRQRIAAVQPVPTGAASALFAANGNDLLVAVADAGRLQRFSQRPLSYCPTATAATSGIDTLVDLDVGGRADFTFNGRVHPSARGVLSNVVRIEPAAGSDPSALAGQARDDSSIAAVSDLAVSKSAPARAVAGTDITWQIRVSNAGPSDALGMRVVDTLPAPLSNVRWSCVATGTSSCPANGISTLDLGATLHVGDELRITLVGRIDASFTGALANRVDLVPETGASDPTPADHVASVSSNVVAEVDLSVAKSDGVERVIAGATTVYTISVANAGPSDAAVVTITDPLPAGISGATWICSPSGGATCPQAGTGDIAMPAAMPVGSALVIRVTAPIADAARGQIDNLVSASAGGVATDTDPSDNSAHDIDQVDVSASVSLELTDALDPYDPNSTLPLPYLIDVFNEGPSSASLVVVDVDFSNPVTFVLPPGCGYARQRLHCEFGPLAAGAHHLVQLALAGLPQSTPEFAAEGVVAAPEPDPTLADNRERETTALRSGADVVVTIQRFGALVTGEPVRYDIVVRNVASAPANAFDVAAPIATGLLGATWTCTASSGTSCTASGSGSILDNVSLDQGESLTYRIMASVDPSLDPNGGVVIEQRVEARTAVGIDINPANNLASDRGQVLYGIFRNGFESPPPSRAKFREASQ